MDDEFTVKKVRGRQAESREGTKWTRSCSGANTNEEDEAGPHANI